VKALGVVIMVAATLCIGVIFLLEHQQHGFSGGFYRPPYTEELPGMLVRHPPSGILAHYWPCLGGVAVFAVGLIFFMAASRRERRRPPCG